MSSNESWWGGECEFLYIEDSPTKEEFLSTVVKDMDMLGKLCDKMPKEMSSSKPSDGRTSVFSGKTAPGMLVFFIIIKFSNCYCSFSNLTSSVFKSQKL